MGSTRGSCVYLHKRVGNFCHLRFSWSANKKKEEKNPWQTPSLLSCTLEEGWGTPFSLLPSDNIPLTTNQFPSASQLSSDQHMTKYYKDCYQMYAECLLPCTALNPHVANSLSLSLSSQCRSFLFLTFSFYSRDTDLGGGCVGFFCLFLFPFH